MLTRVKWKTVIVYLDDVIICSKTVTEHLTRLREALQLLKMVGVTLKLAKCAFFDLTVSHVGHTIRYGQLVVKQKFGCHQPRDSPEKPNRSSSPSLVCLMCTDDLYRASQ